MGFERVDLTCWIKILVTYKNGNIRIMEVKEPVDLTIESLERFLPLAFPREFELSSSRSSYYALITDQVITVVTNRGEFDFDV